MYYRSKLITGRVPGSDWRPAVRYLQLIGDKRRVTGGDVIPLSCIHSPPHPLSASLELLLDQLSQCCAVSYLASTIVSISRWCISTHRHKRTLGPYQQPLTRTPRSSSASGWSSNWRIVRVSTDSRYAILCLLSCPVALVSNHSSSVALSTS